VWDGRYVLVWGGNGGAGRDGARYDPFVDRWFAIDAGQAPTARRGHAALWTGARMLVWGGAASVPLATGGVYDPGFAAGDADGDGLSTTTARSNSTRRSATRTPTRSATPAIPCRSTSRRPHRPRPRAT
jgi:hypothetical protein